MIQIQIYRQLSKQEDQELSKQEDQRAEAATKAPLTAFPLPPNLPPMSGTRAS